MMKKKEFWVGYYVNSLMHMGNRSSNRVESTHANIKRNNQTSSGSMTIVTEKVNLWIKKRVRVIFPLSSDTITVNLIFLQRYIQENYRNLQSAKESMSQKPVYLDSGITDKLSELRLNITSFAYESIKNELMQMKTPEESNGHKAHEKPDKKCYCLLRRNYRLPCKHLLKKYEGVIPLVAVHQRWRIAYIKGRGKCIVFLFLMFAPHTSLDYNKFVFTE
jgi:hypothetical protein